MINTPYAFNLHANGGQAEGYPAGTRARIGEAELTLVPPEGEPRKLPGSVRKCAFMRTQDATCVWLLDSDDEPLFHISTCDHYFVTRLVNEAELERLPAADYHKLTAAFELRKRLADVTARRRSDMGNFGSVEVATLDEIREHKGKKWGDQLRYRTDDRDQASHELCIMQGGNGDWYISVAEGPEHHPVNGVRICTSGGAAIACPGLGLAVSELYRALWRSYVQT